MTHILENDLSQFIKFLVLFFILLLIANSPAMKSEVDRERKGVASSYIDKKLKYMVLLGASVGKAWNLSLLPKRIDNYDYVFEYVHVGGFDKSETLRKIISRRKNKPDALFIKECAAYFPGDLELYKNLMKQWIKECKKENVIPIPTTVVPVTRLHPFKQFLIDIVKGRNPLRYGNPFKNRRNSAILLYNDWIRIYCRRNGLSLLDLEEAVRYSEDNRYLREDFARVDGLHLNTKAYEILDQVVIPTLEIVDWDIKME